MEAIATTLLSKPSERKSFRSSHPPAAPICVPAAGIKKRPRCYRLSMIDWSSCPAAERDPARVSGAWVFKGTRVPIAALFENLEDDASVQQFVEWFPGVSLDQARAVLEHAAKSSLAVA